MCVRVHTTDTTGRRLPGSWVGLDPVIGCVTAWCWYVMVYVGMGFTGECVWTRRRIGDSWVVYPFAPTKPS